jgi:outer membrane lipoprotein-sorting protein
MNGWTFRRALLGTCLAAVVWPCSPGFLAGQAVPDRGRAIAEEADSRARGYGDLEAQLTLVLRNRHGDEKARRLTMQVLEGEAANDRTLLVIDEPRDLQGTTLLTHSEPGGNDQQWLYLPALKRVKRIASGGQTGSFMGSEFSYEDIGSQEVDEYTYRFLREEILDASECFVVERTPLDPESGYRRQIVWFDRAELRIQRIDYYDRDDRLLKTLRLRRFQQYAERFWRPSEMEMTNHQTGRSTTLQWHEYRFETGLKPADFDRSRLKRAG